MKKMDLFKNSDKVNITWKKAVKMDNYKFTSNMSLEEFKKTLEDGTFDFLNNTPFVLEFGNIDIELTVTPDASERGYSLGYFICARVKSESTEGAWESFGYSDLKVDLSCKNIERVMFNELIRFSDKHDLSYSCLN